MGETNLYLLITRNMVCMLFQKGKCTIQHTLKMFSCVFAKHCWSYHQVHCFALLLQNGEQTQPVLEAGELLQRLWRKSILCQKTFVMFCISTCCSAHFTSGFCSFHPKLTLLASHLYTCYHAWYPIVAALLQCLAPAQTQWAQSASSWSCKLSCSSTGRAWH